MNQPSGGDPRYVLSGRNRAVDSPAVPIEVTPAQPEGFELTMHRREPMLMSPPTISIPRRTRARDLTTRALLMATGLLLSGCAEERPRYRVVADSDRRASDENESRTAPAGDAEHPEHGPDVSAASRAEGAEDTSLLERLPPPKGRTLTVTPLTQQRDGLRFPAADLDEALRQLEPGDRLVLEAGQYIGPISIDERMRDGRKPEPIQVVAMTDAVITIADKGSQASAVLRVQRSFWEFHGLEIASPQSGAGGIELQKVKTILIADSHLHDLGGAGIRFGDRVREVTLRDNHIHQIGLGRVKNDAYGVFVNDPTTRLVVDGGQIHHTLLGPIFWNGQVIHRPEEAEGVANLELSGEIK